LILCKIKIFTKQFGQKKQTPLSKTAGRVCLFV